MANSEGRQMAQTFEATRTQPPDPAHYAESSARENLIEHVFLGEPPSSLVQLRVAVWTGYARDTRP
jgi:hypothetical protein